MKKIIIGISGASGVKLGLRFARALPADCEKYLIVSEHASLVFEKEEKITQLDNENIGACTASGSFMADAMVIIPCSMNTLAKVACGIADTLLTRSAMVMLKEKRPLLLAPREMPFDAIALENMLKLSRLGVWIAPPILGYYGEVQNLDKMEDFLVGKWLDMLGVEHRLYQRWEG
ncbi:MAG: UbiX family flavin prenyltransferase [Sulfurospirillaceae bacterium]|nr:UbiX family flavin prenyltransferase [Sulfurospirillaceae bacterium]